MLFSPRATDTLKTAPDILRKQMLRTFAFGLSGYMHYSNN